MEEILSDYIDITNTSIVECDQKRGYVYQGEVYFVLPAYGKEEVYQELQHACNFLYQAGVENMVCPVRMSESRYQINKNQRTYVIGKTASDSSLSYPASAHELARFHELGANYPYHLLNLSSYGQWKTLWGNRIDHFEGLIQQWHQERPVGEMHRLWIDTAPYIIGIGENAIQYVQESEQETRHQQKDQATFTFDRFSSHSQRLIWFDQIRYDHPVRDLAEALRYKVMAGRPTEEVTAFFYDYHTRSPLSIFGLRLLYARLLFPVHLLDKYEEVYSNPFDEKSVQETKLLFKRQRNYEHQLHRFFHALGINTKELKIPVLDW